MMRKMNIGIDEDEDANEDDDTMMGMVRGGG